LLSYDVISRKMRGDLGGVRNGEIAALEAGTG
jgi:hypothetical protein